MRNLGIWILLLLFTSPAVEAEACQQVARQLELPVKVKTRGKPKRVRWEKVDEVLTKLREATEGQACHFSFGQVFRVDPETVFFPLTNNLLRTVSEEALQGVQVFATDGAPLGEFAGRVVYERSGGLYAQRSYALHYFQFKDLGGNLQSSGNRLLLDDFLVKWQDLKDRPLLSSGGSGVPLGPAP